MNTDIELKRLRHFVLLAEERNFTRAAERANLSQTAFSRSILALEERLNVRVFDRGTRSVHLTAAGQQLVAKARQLLEQARNLVLDVEGIANADGGELSFGASLMAVDGVLNGLLPELMRQSPRLTVNVEVNHWRQLQQHLEQERIEFFVSYPGSLLDNSDFTVTSLPAIPSSVFCRPGHPLLSADAQPSPRDLPNYRWATVQLRDAAAKRMQALFGMSANSPLPLALTSNNLSLLREATLSSDMLLFTWDSWLQADVAAGTIIDLGQKLRPALPQKAMKLDFAIIQLKDRTASPAARRMIDLIKGAAKNAPSSNRNRP
ncbi:LysR family transcriptional regulator [Allopusillimonas ginsengisoli]|uniref:LysR family transcriptional regulator n=1 Tax=Allopusillimonas ginsengisoli TaxID=453575 RepID=UPI001020AF30|nr:LysR family transcriptional regulator [Allopusillimonas ginsengisoli]TEA72261.1 LysR family transcriptional regulator [Allopusillimonas ginsengisoli]